MKKEWATAAFVCTVFKDGSFFSAHRAWIVFCTAARSVAKRAPDDVFFFIRNIAYDFLL
jgi:hypothetical protein